MATARQRRAHATAAARWMATLAAVAFVLPAAAAERAHVHGAARLDVAVEARRITLQLDTPLDNLLGFERAPRTAAERQQADAAVARLKDAATLFRIDPAAGCTLARVELNSAALKLGTPDAADAADAKAGHADLEGGFEFACQAGAKAAYIDTALFAFAPLRQVDVQVAAPAGQFKRTLTRTASRLVLTK